MKPRSQLERKTKGEIAILFSLPLFLICHYLAHFERIYYFPGFNAKQARMRGDRASADGN